MRKAISLLFLIVVIAWICNAHSAVEIGGDEGMEFQKAFLASAHPQSLNQMWNDQPYLYTWLCASLFKIFGASPIIPRILTMACVYVLLLLLPKLIRLPASPLRTGITITLFLTWPTVFSLTPVGMCEVPAFCLSCAACALFLSSNSEQRGVQAAAAGFLMAMAINLKLTAAITLPALAFALLFEPVQRRNLIMGFASLGGGLILFWLTLPASSLDMLWGTHSRADQAIRVLNGSVGKWNPYELFDSPSHLAAAILGLVYLFKDRKLGKGAFALGLLATAVVIHLVHRPWWWYYNVHFGVPFSLLGGFGLERALGALAAKARAQEEIALPTMQENALWPLLGVTLCLSLWLGFSVPTTATRVHELRQLPTRQKSELLAKLREISPRAKWAYSPKGLAYLFGAGINVPPELIVLSQKRFWAREINHQGVIATVARYKPEVLLLTSPPESDPAPWPSFVAENYTLVYQDPGFYLFEKRAPGKPLAEKSTSEQLRSIGL